MEIIAILPAWDAFRYLFGAGKPGKSKVCKLCYLDIEVSLYTQWLTCICRNIYTLIHTLWTAECMKGLRVKETQHPYYVVPWRKWETTGRGGGEEGWEKRGGNSFFINTFYGKRCDFVIYGRTCRLHSGNLQINPNQTSSLMPIMNTVSALEYT